MGSKFEDKAVSLCGRALALFVLLAIFGVTEEKAVQMRPEEILKANEQTVVLVGSYGEGNRPLTFGSGFVVHPNGVIVTSFHVLQGAHSAKVFFANSSKYPVEGIVGYDYKEDIALVKIRASGLHAVTLGDSDQVKKGDQVIAIGNPEGQGGEIYGGQISGTLAEFEGSLFTLTAVIPEGSSGGPLFNLKGEVIGVANAIIKEGRNMTLAVPINDIKPLISEKIALDLPELAARFPLRRAATKPAARVERPAGAAPKSQKPDLELAVEYAGRAEFEKAVHHYKKHLEAYPNDHAAHRDLGIIYFKLREISAAVTEFREAIRLNAKDETAWFYLGRGYTEAASYDDAIEAFQKALSLNANNHEARMELALDLLRKALIDPEKKDKELINKARRELRLVARRSPDKSLASRARAYLSDTSDEGLMRLRSELLLPSAK